MTTPISLMLTGHAVNEQTQTYTTIPFEVPPGIGRIDVRYEYSDEVGSDPMLTDGNTVDIGIFDSRGGGFMSEGFRGWSGSARHSFFIAADDSTPGYLAGPIQPGTWNIALGLYKIAPKGCDYHVEITLSPGSGEGGFAPLLPLRSTLGKVKPDGWYCGEVHNHSYHSDGDSDPLDIVRRAEALGLDFLAITDHNNISHLARLNTVDTSLILIPGFEVTTYKGHWNVWGGHGWIDFRVEDEAHMAQAVAEAKRRGYLVSLNHPRPYGPDWAYPNVDDLDCIEVWNGPWELMNDVALEFWESRLRQGKRYTAVGGSDNHFLKREHVAQLAVPTLWVYCDGEPSADKLLDSIRAGHVMISNSVSGPRLRLTTDHAMMGDVVSHADTERLVIRVGVHGGAGCWLELHTTAGLVERQVVQGDQFDLDFRAAPDSAYARAQIVDANGQVCA
ncbi:MAG: CehA/McbA family metallohydrolase [Anaerolineae bacterium]